MLTFIADIVGLAVLSSAIMWFATEVTDWVENLIYDIKKKLNKR